MLFVVLIISVFTSCSNRSKYNGLILTDENTGKKYQLEYRIGDVYFINEQITQISGKDTTVIFK